MIYYPSVQVMAILTIMLQCKNCSDYLPHCLSCSPDRLNCSTCIQGYFLLSLPESASSPARSMCVPDCARFLTHRPDFTSQTCLPDCHDGCPTSACGSDGQCATTNSVQCLDWSFLLPDGTCSEFGCPSGSFRDASSKTCQKCDPSCTECSGPNHDQCLTCRPQTFLQLNPGSSNEGICTNKQSIPSTFSLVVSNSLLVIQDTKSPQDRDGSLDNPYIDLRDALTRAAELAAPTAGAAVQILLTRGDHFLLLETEAARYHIPPGSVKSHPDFFLTIKPLPCSFSPNLGQICVQEGETGQLVRVLSKMDAYFSLKAPASLTIQDIAFDFSDSLLPWNSYCHARRSQTCQVTTDTNQTISVLSTDSDCSCRSEPLRGDHCSYNHPLSFIEPGPSSSVTLTRCHFQHVYAPFNSLVGLSPSLALTITDSLFEDISMCGAILNSQTESPSSQALQALFINHPGSQPSPGSPSTILIQGSEFRRLGLFLSFPDIHSIRERAYTSTTYDGLSPVLNLKSYPADVRLLNNFFEKCKLLFPSLMDVVSTSIESPVEDGGLALSKTGLLAQGVLVIRDHSHGLSLINNVFQDSTTLRGTVIVEISADYQKGAFIYGNTFERVFSAYTSPTLNLKSAWLKDALTSCSGFHIEANYFGRVLLSPNGLALLSLACLFPQFGQSDSVIDISGPEFQAYPYSAQGRVQPLPSPLPFSYQVPGQSERVSVDFSQTVLRDNVMAENLRFKGEGQMLSVFFMRNVLIDGLSLLRNGDFSLSQEYASPTLFWKDFGAINWSQSGEAPLFENAKVSDAANIGDALFLLGGVTELVVRGVFALENWYWQTDGTKQAHFLIFQESQNKLQGLEIISLIEGHLSSLTDYLKSPHSLYSRNAVLSVGQNQSTINGALLYSQSMTWEGGRLEDVRVTEYVLFVPRSVQQIVIQSVILREVFGFSFVNYSVGTLLEFKGVSFFNFEFFYVLDTDRFSIYDSLFDNTGFGSREVTMRFIIIWQVYTGRSIQRSTFINVCGGKCHESFAVSFASGSLISVTDSTVKGFKGHNFLLLILGDIHIENSLFEELESLEGEPIKGTGDSTIIVTNSVFRRNKAISGGVFSIFSQTTLRAQNCLFEENTSLSAGGVISAYTSGILQFRNCTFRKNEASSASIINGIGKQKDKPWLVSNTTIQSNRGLGTLKLMDVSVKLDNVLYQGNHDLHNVSTPIMLFSSVLHLNNSKFTNQHYPELKCPQSSSESGGFFYDFSENQITVENSLFTHVCAYHGGAFYLRGFSSFSILHSNFTHCQSVGQGGAFFASSYKALQIADSLFLNNSAGDGASDLFVQDSASTLTLARSSFSHSSGSLVIGSVRASLNITTSSFRFISQASQPASTIVSCMQCGYFGLSDNLLSDIETGSAVQLMSSTSAAQSTPFLIRGNQFQRIKGVKRGGAIMMGDAHNLTIQSNSFKSIQLEGTASKGAAIYLMNREDNQRVEVKQNKFEKCEASSGAALFWQFKSPLLSDNSFVNNSASIYGQDTASYPVKIAFIDSKLGSSLFTESPFPATVVGEDTTSVIGARSGGTLPELYIAALDLHDQIVTHIHGDIAQMTVNQLVAPGATLSTFAPTLRQENTGEWRNGVFKLQRVSFIGEPGQNYEILVSSTHIDPSLPDTRRYLSEQGLSTSSITINVSLRKCESGEGFLSDGRCEQCSSLTYLLEPPQSPQECLACPINTECFGGNKIAPAPGYWRSGTNSLEMKQCLNPAACVGSQNDENYEPTGSCHSGYLGTLCATCETGYTRNSLYECSKCPNKATNIGIIVTLLIVFSAIFILIIRLSLKAVGKRKSLFTVYFKILINHFQVLMLISSFDLEWPSQVQTFLDASKTVADGPTVVFSFDCFMDTSIGKPFDRFYLYLLAYFLLPAVIGLIALFFWRLKYIHSTTTMCTRVIQTLLIVFYLIHPSITQIFLQSFDCVSIDQQSFLKENLSQECWQGDHLRFALSVGLLGLLLWSIGTPLISFYLLYRKRNYLHTTDLKQKLGFLYNGYSPRAYYWETSITLRKLLIAFVSIFLTSKGTMLQSLVLFVILFSSILFTQRIRPYEDFRVNCLEMVSLFALLVTAYCGIFFLSSRNPGNPDFVSGKDLDLSAIQRWFLFLILVSSNLLFMCMWLWRILLEFRNTLIKKTPKCFTRCILCGNKKKLKKQAEHILKMQLNSCKIKLIQEIQDQLTNKKKLYQNGKDFAQMELFEDQTKYYRKMLERLDDQDDSKVSRDSIALGQLGNFHKSQGTSLLIKAIQRNVDLPLENGDTSQESMPSTRRDLLPRGDSCTRPQSNMYSSRANYSPRVTSGFCTVKGERLTKQPVSQAWQAVQRQITGQVGSSSPGDFKSNIEMLDKELNEDESENLELENISSGAEEEKQTTQNQEDQGLERSDRLQLRHMGTFEKIMNELEGNLGPIRKRVYDDQRVATQGAARYENDTLPDAYKTGNHFHTQMGEI